MLILIKDQKIRLTGVPVGKVDAKLNSGREVDTTKMTAKTVKATAKAMAKATKMSAEGVEVAKKVGKRVSAPLVEGDPLALRMSSVTTVDAPVVEDSKALSDFING